MVDEKKKNPTVVKTVLDYCVYLFVRILFCIIQILPISACDRFAHALAYLFWRKLKFRKKVILENLSHVFPKKTEQELGEIAYGMWHHLLLMAFEIAHSYRIVHDSNWRRYFTMIDRRAVVGAMLDRRPVVLVAGHFGNFELGGFVAGVLGVPTYTVARDLDNPFLHQFINDLREKSGQYILPKAGSSDLVEKALSDGHTMTLLGDQYAGDKGCWVEFLGRKASCHKALALFTLTSGAPMVVVSTTRAGGPMQFVLRDHGVADPKDLEESQQSVKGLTTWYNDRMAEQILKSPEQYWWVHRRWKPKQKRKKPATA